MKGSFTVEPKEFAAAVAFSARWLAPKPSVPEWAGVLLKAEDGRLTLSTYDEDVTSRAVIGIQGEATGAVLVSGRLLGALVGTFPAKPVMAEVADGALVLTAGRVVVTLPLMETAGYPTLPETPATVATVAGGSFGGAVARVAVAASKEVTALQWTAVRLAFGGDRLEVMGSDSRRAAQALLPGVDGTKGEALVPAGVLAEAAKLMSGAAEVEIGLSDNLAAFTMPGRTLAVRQITGPYKTRDVHGAIGYEPPASATVDRGELLTAVKRTQLMRTEGQPTTLTWEAGAVIVASRGTESGAAAGETLDAEYDGADVRLACNPQYLADALDAVGGEVVRIGFDPAKPNRPILITDPEDEAYRHVVVPINIDKIQAKPTKPHKRNQPESMD